MQDGRVSRVVQILQFIFNLTLTEPSTWYKLQAGASDAIKQTIKELHQLGLLTKKSPEDADSRFCIN